jgi:diacylglycerol kinase family enzyme
MFPFAEDRPDKMQLRIALVRSVDFVKNFAAIFRGEYDNPELIFDYFVDDVEIEMDPVTSFQVGGDVQGERTKVRVRLADPIPVVDFYAPPRG